MGDEFVGRDEERAVLASRFEELQEGRSWAVAIPGYSGFGKTSLMRQLDGSSIGSESLIYVELLFPEEAPITFRAICREVADKLTRMTNSEGTRIFPEVDKPVEAAGVAESISHLKRLLDSLAEVSPKKSLVIAIDEAQLVDSESIHALKALVQSGSRIGVVLAWRIYEESGSVADLYVQSLQALKRERDSDRGILRTFAETVLPLHPFRSPDEARACVERRLDQVAGTIPDEIIDAIVQCGQGSPGAIVTLCHDAYDQAIRRAARQVGNAVAVEAEDFHVALKNRFPHEVARVRAELAVISDEARLVLHRLVELGPAASVDEIAARDLDQGDPKDHDHIVGSIRSELMDIGATDCASIRFDPRSDSVIIDSVPVFHVLRMLMAN